METDVATTHSEGTAHQKLLDNRHNQIRAKYVQTERPKTKTFFLYPGIKLPKRVGVPNEAEI